MQGSFSPCSISTAFFWRFHHEIKLFLWLCMSVPKGKRIQSVSFLHRRNFGSHFPKGNFLQLWKTSIRWAAANLGKKPSFWILAIQFSTLNRQTHTDMHKKKPHQTEREREREWDSERESERERERDSIYIYVSLWVPFSSAYSVILWKWS